MGVAGVAMVAPGTAFAQSISGIGTRTIQVNGKTVYNVPGFVSDGTTYMPIWYVQQVLRRIGVQNTWNGQEWDISAASSPASAGYHAARGSDVRAIVFDGAITYKVASIVYHGTTYMPIWYVQQVISRLGDSSTWHRPVWNIVLAPNQHYQYPTPFGTGSTKTITVNGKPVYHAPGIVHSHTTYMPIWYVQQALDDVGLQNVWDHGEQWDISSNGAAPQPDAAVSNPSGERAIVVNGKQVMELPCFVYQGTTYMQVYSIEVLLRKLGLTTSWNGWTWDISQPANPMTGGAQTASPLIFGFMTNYTTAQTSLDDAMQHQGQIGEMGTFVHEITVTGGVTGTPPAATMNYAAQQHIPVLATVTNLTNSGFDASEIDTVLKSSSASAALEQNIAQMVASEGYSGAVLDFEAIPAADGADYASFVDSLAQALHSAGKTLAVAVPADTGADNEPWNDGYPYAQLGAAADQIIIMAYDVSYPGSQAGPIAPVPWVNSVLAYATQVIPANKILLGIDAYGYDWITGSTQATARSLSAIDDLIQANHVTPSRDAASDAPYFTYTSNGVQHTVYYEDQQSTSAKLQLAQKYGVLGIAIWHIGLDNQAIWNAVTNYTAAAASSSTTASSPATGDNSTTSATSAASTTGAGAPA